MMSSRFWGHGASDQDKLPKFVNAKTCDIQSADMIRENSEGRAAEYRTAALFEPAVPGQERARISSGCYP